MADGLTGRLVAGYWRSLRQRLESALSQRLAMHAPEIITLREKYGRDDAAARVCRRDNDPLLVAANWNARVTVAGFIIFILAALAWMADGLLDNKISLVIQNAILLVINIFGAWRWLPRAEREQVRNRPSR